jgi:ABC-type branched-subunit amino acid transport system substrate-binding protein
MPSLATCLKTFAVALLATAVAAGCTPKQSTKPRTTSQAPQSTPAAPTTPGKALLPGQPVKVALLVPLSGSAQPAGEALLNAAQLALFDVGDQTLELIVKDTGETEAGAAAAASAAIGEGAQLVLGPLFGSQINAVNAVAQGAGVNVISFSNDETKAGGNAFIMGLSPREQAKRIVGYAVSQGRSTIAVIAPNTPFGAQMLAGAQEVPGATVISSILYDTNKVDLSQEVQSLGTGYQAVLMPDTAKRMLGLAPLLAYNNANPSEVKYLGSALWQDPLIGTEPNLVGAWFPAAPPAPWELFVARYQQAYGSEPLRIAGLGYDAVALAATLVGNARKGQVTEASAAPGQWIGLDRNSITVPTGFAGVDGIFRFRQDGRVERGLAVLGVERNSYTIVQDAPAGFQALTN